MLLRFLAPAQEMFEDGAHGKRFQGEGLSIVTFEGGSQLLPSKFQDVARSTDVMKTTGYSGTEKVSPNSRIIVVMRNGVLRERRRGGMKEGKCSQGKVRPFDSL